MPVKSETLIQDLILSLGPVIAAPPFQMDFEFC